MCLCLCAHLLFSFSFLFFFFCCFSLCFFFVLSSFSVYERLYLLPLPLLFFSPSRIHFLWFFFSVVIIVYLFVSVYASVSPSPFPSNPSFQRVSPSLFSCYFVVMAVVCPYVVFARFVRSPLLHLAACMQRLFGRRSGRRLFGHSGRYSADVRSFRSLFACSLASRCS